MGHGCSLCPSVRWPACREEAGTQVGAAPRTLPSRLWAEGLVLGQRCPPAALKAGRVHPHEGQAPNPAGPGEWWPL